MAKTTTIYGLIDPRDGLIHYVGKTTQSMRVRLLGHAYEAKPHPADGRPRGFGRDKIAWLIQLREAGLEPSVKILEEVELSEARRAEIRWIASLYKEGHPLTNSQNTAGLHRSRRATVFSKAVAADDIRSAVWLEALTKHDGNIARAAEEFGFSRQRGFTLTKRHGLVEQASAMRLATGRKNTGRPRSAGKI